MHPLFIALIFVVTMALPAILVVRRTVRPGRELAPAHGPAHRLLTHSDEGSLVVPIRAGASAPSNRGAKKPEHVKTSKQQQAIALEHQVEDTIDRLILMN